MKSFVYLFLKILNDVNAIFKGRIGKRIGWRILGKIVGRGAGRLFR